jgi:hypothetical protein
MIKKNEKIMARPKSNIDWNKVLTNDKQIVNKSIYSALVDESEPMIFNNEGEYQIELLKYLNDICLKLEFAFPKKVHTNVDYQIAGRRVKFDILIEHVDETITIIECKYSKDVSPGERLIKQVKGIGQIMLYGEMFFSGNGIRPRLFISDEKPEELTLVLLRKQHIGFIAVKNNRIFTMY